MNVFSADDLKNAQKILKNIKNFRCVSVAGMYILSR